MSEEKITKIIEERFPELFQPLFYTPNYLIKSELLEYVNTTKQTIEEITKKYNKEHEIPVSRVKVNILLNELEAEGKIKIERKEEKYVFKVNF